VESATNSLFEISRMSSMMVSREEAKLETIIRFSRCCRVSSDSSVRTVIPMIPFIGVLHVSIRLGSGALITHLISCDMLARNSLLLLLAVSACCLALVFFSIDSRRLYTIWLIFVLRLSISPLASTVIKRVKSPSVAAAEI